MTFCEQLENIRKQIFIQGNVCSKAHFAKMIGMTRSNYATMLENDSCTEYTMNRIVKKLCENGYLYNLEIKIVEMK